LNGRTHPLGQASFRRRQGDAIAAFASHFHIVARKAAEDIVPNRNGKLLQFSESLLHVLRLADFHRHAARADILREIGIADARLAERLANIAADRIQPILNHLLLVELI
jgi:hypothetical protein